MWVSLSTKKKYCKDSKEVYYRNINNEAIKSFIIMQTAFISHAKVKKQETSSIKLSMSNMPWEIPPSNPKFGILIAYANNSLNILVEA